MTVIEWLNCINGNPTYYEQAIMLDSDGNEVHSWYGSDDPKYKANVIDVKPKYPDEPWICALIHTDWKEN